MVWLGIVVAVAIIVSFVLGFKIGTRKKEIEVTIQKSIIDGNERHIAILRSQINHSRYRLDKVLESLMLMRKEGYIGPVPDDNLEPHAITNELEVTEQKKRQVSRFDKLSKELAREVI